ncbi:membrane protein [Moraxella ovis]|uniref:Probable membrane transporter protein n=1 Tax=Moraxella ovis TaxID=29433 RepID=A0A378PIN3_9GAMM|nr:TSUP family transporter [Moraxella ovis]ANB91116.1 membrane protein [Moraxella ovis]STY86633.1 Sulfite exporter TauE/SafE [Moraxella ovis]
MFVDGSIIAQYFYIGLTLLILASFIAGYIDAVAGGAGLILVPAFMLVGLPPQLALGQEKLVSTIGTVAAIKNFIKAKSIIWKIVPIGIVSALIGAFIGAKAILMFPSHIIEYIIFAFLPIGLIATLFKGKIVKDNQGEIKKSALAVFITCLLVGFYDGFFGPGTGSIFIIALYLINSLSLLQASATSKIFNFSSNIGAFVAFAIAGKMAFAIGIPMIIANLLGNHFGSLHAIKSDGAIIKKVLVVTVGLMMVTLVYKFIF